MLEQARLRPAVREQALAIFEALGRAEAAVHGVALARVHFHEVGAVDAIVDVAGAAIGLDLLGIARVTASAVALGDGSVETAHGRLPLPAPATLELLRGIPTVPAHVHWETVTPTGAAILRSVVEEFRSLPALTIEAIGHGAGEDRSGPMPNVLRAVLGHAERRFGRPRRLARDQPRRSGPRALRLPDGAPLRSRRARRRDPTSPDEEEPPGIRRARARASRGSSRARARAVRRLDGAGRAGQRAGSARAPARAAQGRDAPTEGSA